MNKNKLAWSAATKASSLKRTPIHHPKNLKHVDVNVGAGHKGLRVEEQYARRSNKLWMGESQRRVTTSDPTGANASVYVTGHKGMLSPLGRKVRNYGVGGAAGAAYGGLLYRDYKASSTPNYRKETKELAKSVWGVPHGPDSVEKLLRGSNQQKRRNRMGIGLGMATVPLMGATALPHTSAKAALATGAAMAPGLALAAANRERPKVAKHYLGFHGDGRHHDRSQHRELRYKKKSAKKHANSASRGAYYKGQQESRKKGDDTFYDFGRSMSRAFGPETEQRYVREVGHLSPSQKKGYQAQEAWEKSKAGKQARRKQGRAKADWNPRWGERHGYKTRDVRKNMAIFEEVAKVGFTPILSPATRAIREGQVAGKAATQGARAMFGGRSQNQFGAVNARLNAMRGKGVQRFGGKAQSQYGAVTNRLAQNRATGAGRFTQTQGGGAVPRGAGASAHSAASSLRQPKPNLMQQHGKKIAVGAAGAGAVGAGAYGVHKAFKIPKLGGLKTPKPPMPPTAPTPAVQRSLQLASNPKVGNVSRVGSQKFAAPTPRLRKI